MRAPYLLIVNPRSANGSTGRRWPRIEERLRAVLPPFHVVLTQAPGDAAGLASEAAKRYKVVAAVGGDGTVSEVVNGLVDEGGRVRRGTALGVIPRGTGSDFVRSLGVPSSLTGAAAVLAAGHRREIDVGRARFRNSDGTPATRYFINAAEVGMGAAVAETVNQASRRPGGSAAFWWAILVTMFRYRDQPASLSVDGSPPERAVLSTAWIANGRFSGAGIRSAPRARLDDGLLDLVWVSHLGPAQRVAGLLKLRSGAFINMAEVKYRQARLIQVTTDAPVPVETDGDPVGHAPATFDLLPVRLPVICPADR